MAKSNARAAVNSGGVISKPRMEKIDDFDKCVIRNTIRQFYVNNEYVEDGYRRKDGLREEVEPVVISLNSDDSDESTDEEVDE